ncbi:MAG: O-antigen ligase domain-containing protein [Planctomycetota bacterium]|nr:MAG: O-antigen ligase domain-containing protein [Planctomycetota bacterium]
MATASRPAIDVDGLGGRRAAPAAVPAAVTVVTGALAAVLGALTHYGGGLWQLVVLIAILICMGLAAWLLTYRQFIQLVAILFAFTFPMRLNVELWPFPQIRVRSGMPPGVALWHLDLFLLILWTDWFVDVCLHRARPSARIGPAARWLGLMFLAAAFFPVHTTYLPASVMLYVEFLRYGLAFVYLAKKVDSVTVLRWMVYGICAQVWIESLIAWAQYAAGGTLGLRFLGETRLREEPVEGGAILRTGALMGHPNRFAEWLVLVGPYPLAMALQRRLSLSARAFFWATFVVLNVSLILTFSRAGWVCAAFNALATYHLALRRLGKPIVVSLWTPLIAGVAVCVFLIVAVEEVRARLFSDDRGSTFARIPQFVTALNMIAHRPFFGVGLGSYSANIHRFANFDGRYLSTLYFRVHNGLLLWTAETGVLGGFSYLMFWFHNLKKGWGVWRLKDDFLALTGIATVIGLISWWIKSMYNIHSPLTDYPMWMHAAMIYVVYNCAARLQREQDAAAAPAAT